MNLKSIAKLSMAAISVVLIFFIAEILFRLSPSYQRDDFAWMSKNVILNNFGYRDNHVDLMKKPNLLRIYSLGDSYTYGWYIDDVNLTYPAILEKGLKRKFGENKIEVINASQPGFNLEESLNRLKTEGLLFSPDVITLGINIYDLLDREFVPKIKRDTFQNLRLYDFLINRKQKEDLSKKTAAELHKAIESPSPQLAKAREMIHQMNQLTSSSGGKFVLIIFPNYDPSLPKVSYQYEDFHIQFAKIAQEEKIDLIDPLDVFNQIKDKNKLILNPTDAHPSILAHQLIAQKIINHINFQSLSKQVTAQKVTEKTINLGNQLDRLNAILSISAKDETVVYFRKEFGLGVEKHVLIGGDDRKLAFMADFLKTARSFTHDGWPGAKIEYHVPASSIISINSKLYNFPIIGVHQFSVFYRENGATLSRDLSFSELEIFKNENQNLIEIKILAPGNFDFYRIIFDVLVKQVDIENDILQPGFQTEFLSQKGPTGKDLVTILTDKRIGSWSKYISNGASLDYVWVDNKQKQAEIIKKDHGIKVKFLVPLTQHSTVFVPVATDLDTQTQLNIKFL